MRHIFFSFATVVALAAATIPRNGAAQDHPSDTRSATGNSNANGPKSVPEFDAATGGAIAAIVAGGGVLLARRRKR